MSHNCRCLCTGTKLPEVKFKAESELKEDTDIKTDKVVEEEMARCYY